MLNSITRTLTLSCIYDVDIIGKFAGEVIGELGSSEEALQLGNFFAGHLSESSSAPMVTLSSPAGAAEGSVPAQLLADVSGLLAEVRVYIHLLVLVSLVKRGQAHEACGVGLALVAFIEAKNRFTLAPLAAKAYYYLARAYELDNRSAEIRSLQMAALRTAALRSDDECQAVLLNCLVRSFLLANQYDKAYQLVVKSRFPPSASSNQVSRFSYYVGRIHAIRLDYADALTLLQDSLRKAPQGTALGFRQEVHKLITIVQLLMGELPPACVPRGAALVL